jgi:hypothetical protein
MLFSVLANSLLFLHRRRECLEKLSSALTGFDPKLRRAGWSGFGALMNRVDKRFQTRAWSKPAERIGSNGYEESKPAK